MKAPNKIYAAIVNDGLFASVIPNKTKDEPFSEYIRKDALLEWAKEQLNENVGQYDEDYDLAFNVLIEKLNKL